MPNEFVACAAADFCPIFFFNDTATTEIYTLSLHDALPIYAVTMIEIPALAISSSECRRRAAFARRDGDRKSTRLNSSHLGISYAVFCLKKKRNLRAACGVPTILIASGANASNTP